LERVLGETDTKGNKKGRVSILFYGSHTTTEANHTGEPRTGSFQTSRKGGKKKRLRRTSEEGDSERAAKDQRGLEDTE